MTRLLILLLVPAHLLAQPFSSREIARWEKQAKQVTIIRDQWGIPHIYGKTNADAVFGLLYAQCEDDFQRVEMNYIEKLGRMAEVYGAWRVYDDLLIRLVIDSADAVRDYQRAPAWLRKLLQAYADGINYYLYKNPQVKPKLLHRFQPWYPLLWTDGSIGAISTGGATVRELKTLYDSSDLTAAAQREVVHEEEVVTGSNGFAIAPAKTVSGNAILYINPHVTFYFRPEVHVKSEEGLNVYGAVTWGQFFVYQGFNPYCGWMHTSSFVDVADLYIEKLKKQGDQWVYEYENSTRKATTKTITLRYKDGNTLAQKNITAIYTHHGPIVAKRNGQYLALKANNRSMDGLIQSWKRTTAKSLAEFRKIMDMRANTSNNTVYADADGNIAYWHGNFIPKRDPQYDWSKPVPGHIAATEWKGLHAVDETIHLINPPNHWLQNCNSTPFTVAGTHSPAREKYPAYMAPDGENFRGINAVRVLAKEDQYTIDKVIAAGYDTYLAAFEELIPALVKAYEANLHKNDWIAALRDAVAELKKWDLRVAENSVATTLAIEWAQRLQPSIARLPGDQVQRTHTYARQAAQEELLEALDATIKDLEKRFGKWQVAWGDINRFQRISGDIDQRYHDDSASLPVAYASSQWGMLPSYTSRTFPGTQKRYGVNGNSFICAVEFTRNEKKQPVPKAKALLAGGQSGDPASPHFADQALMFTRGQFREVLFEDEVIRKNAEKVYRPGE